MTHGTRYAYERGGCRCEPCRRVQTQRRKAQREKQNATGAPINHGTLAAYVSRKCRCAECRDAWAAAFRRYRPQWTMQRHRVVAAQSVIFADEAERRATAEREALESACAENPELAALVAEQQKDARVGHRADSQWLLSLDEPMGKDEQRYDLVAAEPHVGDRLWGDAAFVAPLLATLDHRHEIDRRTEEALAAPPIPRPAKRRRRGKTLLSERGERVNMDTRRAYVSDAWEHLRGVAA